VDLRFPSEDWGLILGGSSGFGLATAHKLAEQGLNLCIVHRDRRGAMRRIEPEFDKVRSHGSKILTFNKDALDAEVRGEILACLAEELGEDGRVRILLHSVAFGNLKLLVPEQKADRGGLEALADRLGVEPERVREAVNELFDQGRDELVGLADAPVYSDRAFLEEGDFARTIHAMGTSLVGWAKGLLEHGLYAPDARVFGLTSEGNSVAWKGYAAVAAAKSALESVARGLALELAPHGVRTNVIQAGITDTPALRAIPGSAHLVAQARLRNPFGRLTTPRDVANVISLLCTSEAAWINGEVIRVDGGEHISGAST
jgi:NAD(P)-dependent dehydrogenase (short-subunit alcohol dehydrogenase family)